jgi:hypothetical protein
MVVDEIKINLKKYNLFVLAIVLLLVVLAFPTFVRFYEDNDSLVGSESYYHFRAAAKLLSTDSYSIFTPPEDIQDISFSPRSYFFNPYHFLLAFASKVVSLHTASRIVPFLLGIFSMLIFNLILKRFINEDYKRHIILILLIINPAFIYTFTVSNPHAAAIALSLLGIHFFLREKRYNLILSALCFAVVSLFSIFNTLLVVLILLAYILIRKHKHSWFTIILFVLAIFSFTRRASFFYNYAFSPDVNVVGNLFSDLGGIIGFGIFTIILAVYGIVSNWKHKSDFMPFFLLSVALLVSLFFIGNLANMYIMFFVTIAAGIGFVRLYELKWNVLTVKNLTLLILACGLIFSATSYMTRLTAMPPDKATIESLDWLGDHAFKDEFILSHYDNGYLISTVARNPVLVDSLSASDYDQQFLYKVQDTLFYSRKLPQTKQLLEAYKIKYIYITPEMKQGLVWSKPNEGLLFLLTSKSTFNKVYEKDDIEIWEVINTTVS